MSNDDVLASVVVLRVCPVSRLVAVTVAPAITAPEASVTVPASAPVEALWAKAGETRMHSASRQTSRTHAILNPALRRRELVWTILKFVPDVGLTWLVLAEETIVAKAIDEETVALGAELLHPLLVAVATLGRARTAEHAGAT